MDLFRKIFSKTKPQKWFYDYYVPQSSCSENNLACIAMLLKFGGNPIPNKHLCSYSRPDFIKPTIQSIYALLESARLAPVYFNVSAKQLMQQKLPCILFWKEQRFVVLVEIIDDYFYLLDPADTRTEYYFDDFECYFCEEGLAVELSPSSKNS